MLTPSTLADVTGDGVADIVLASFSERVTVLDGTTFRPVWNVTFAGCETYSPAAAGDFDGDSVPDLAVTYHCGQGYPVYEHSRTVVLSGRNGSRLAAIDRSPIGPESATITLAVAGRGNDAFLQWRAHCKGHQDKQLKYTFPECKLANACLLELFVFSHKLVWIFQMLELTIKATQTSATFCTGWTKSLSSSRISAATAQRTTSGTTLNRWGRKTPGQKSSHS